jgi:hypothetical protein
MTALEVFSTISGGWDTSGGFLQKAQFIFHEKLFATWIISIRR